MNFLGPALNEAVITELDSIRQTLIALRAELGEKPAANTPQKELKQKTLSGLDSVITANTNMQNLFKLYAERDEKKVAIVKFLIEKEHHEALKTRSDELADIERRIAAMKGSAIGPPSDDHFMELVRQVKTFGLNG